MKKNYQHTIDFIFPIALFFVFCASAITVLLFSANIYQNIVTNSASQFEQTTSLSYITTKIRQNDREGADRICVDEFDGHEALAIEQTFSDTAFITYIYEVDGELKEIFLQKGIDVSPQSGTAIMEIEHLDMEELSEGLLKFSSTASDGTTDSVIISLHSEAN
mgnify:FL=1